MKLKYKKALPQLVISALLFCTHNATAEPADTRIALESTNNSPTDVKSAKPIAWYHPIKKALAPIEDLETQGIKMEQTIMKLSGPISELSNSMAGTDKTMTSVASQMGDLQTQVISTYKEVCGARKDIAGMRQDVHSLKAPVNSLRKPIEELEKPLGAIKQQLAIIVFAVLFGGAATAIGIPISCIVFWRFRAKLMPGISQAVPSPDPAPAPETVPTEQPASEIAEPSST